MTKNLTTGGLIRERRIAQALSLGQLASRLGVPPASVRAWERGDEALPEKLVPSVSDALGLEAADLLRTLSASSAEKAKESKPSKAAPAAAVPVAAAAAAKESVSMEAKAAPAAAVPVPAEARPKKSKAAKAKTDPAAKAAKKPEVDAASKTDSESEAVAATGEPVVEPLVEPVVAADLVEEAALPNKVSDEQAKTSESKPADVQEELVDDEKVATDTGATEPPGDDSIEASEEPADAVTPLTDLPTEVVDAIPVAFTEEVTQAVPQVPARPTVDDLASTAAVDALLSGSATATSSTQVVGAPVTVVAEKMPYWKDPNQRWRYWARAIATVAIMGAFLVVLGWAFGELSDALGGFLDQFSDASDADPLNR